MLKLTYTHLSSCQEIMRCVLEGSSSRTSHWLLKDCQKLVKRGGALKEKNKNRTARKCGLEGLPEAKHHQEQSDALYKHMHECILSLTELQAHIHTQLQFGSQARHDTDTGCLLRILVLLLIGSLSVIAVWGLLTRCLK